MLLWYRNMIYDEIASNVRRTWMMIFVVCVLLWAMGYVFGRYTGFGYWGVALAVVISIVMSVSSYYYSDKIVLTMSGARPATKEEFPHFVNSVEGVAIAAGIPVPKIYVLEDTAPNAFATGRDPEHAAICATTGLLQKMNRVELEGVIAHEMSHIRNRDILLSTVIVVLVGVIALLSDWMMRSFWWGGGRRNRDNDSGGGNYWALIALVLAILAPIAAMMIQLALSRRREFLADASGALLTRYPEGLASALEKISQDPEPLEAANKATAHMYIANPLKDIGGAMNSLFDTHPPAEERIKRLRAM